MTPFQLGCFIKSAVNTEQLLRAARSTLGRLPGQTRTPVDKWSQLLSGVHPDLPRHRSMKSIPKRPIKIKQVDLNKLNYDEMTDRLIEHNALISGYAPSAVLSNKDIRRAAEKARKRGLDTLAGSQIKSLDYLHHIPRSYLHLPYEPAKFFYKIKDISEHGDPKLLGKILKDPKQRKAFNAATISHEGAELGKHHGSMPIASHLSVGPLLHDINIAKTLSDAPDVKAYISNLREHEVSSLTSKIPDLERLQLDNPNAPRISRHAKKRIAEIFDRNSMRGR